MAGYWTSSFLQDGDGTDQDRDEVEVHELTKKGTRSVSSHIDQTSSVNKIFIVWLPGKFLLQDTAGSPERARFKQLSTWGIGRIRDSYANPRRSRGLG